MPFVYGILPLNLVVGLHQLFVVNIRVSAWISTSYISWTHVKNLSTNGYKLLQNMSCMNKHVIGLYQISKT